MIRNLREIILNRIAEIIKGNDYDEIYATGNSLIAGCIRLPEVPTPCSKCSNYLESLRTGKTLVCNCTLGLPSITCTYEYKSNIE